MLHQCQPLHHTVDQKLLERVSGVRAPVLILILFCFLPVLPGSPFSSCWGRVMWSASEQRVEACTSSSCPVFRWKRTKRSFRIRSRRGEASLRGLSIRKHDLKTTFMYSERILLELLLVEIKKEKENFSYLSNHIFSAQTITLTVLCLFFIPPSHSQHVFFGNTPLFPLFSSSWWGQTHTDMLRLFSRWPQKQQAGQDHVVQGPWEDS